MVRKHVEEVICQDNVKGDTNGNLDSNEQKCMTSLIQLDFVKSALTINPCMVSSSAMYLEYHILFQSHQ